jgi:transcriptional regulator with XRE-family HTH domain
MLSFPQILKNKRIEKGLSLRKVAKIVNCSAGHLHKIEEGKSDPKLSLVIKLRDLLHFSYSEIFPNNVPIDLLMEVKTKHINALRQDNRDLKQLLRIERRTNAMTVKHIQDIRSELENYINDTII